MPYNFIVPPGSNQTKKNLLLHAVLCLLFYAVSITTVQAQKNKLPPFQMVLASGKLFKAQQLPVGKPILLIYFSPDCDHCQKLMQQLLKHQKELNHVSVALITHRPVQEVAAFVKQFGLERQPNFYIGTEGNSFFVRNYYQLEQLPFMALFTKNGDLVKKYFSEKEWNDLLKQLKSLN